MSLALCVKKEDIIKSEYPDYVNHACIAHDVLAASRTYLLERDVCETDTDYIQLIPYITLFCKVTKRIFMYKRGKASGESRLHGMCSIGLGGHIEEFSSEGIYQTLTHGALRELNEEIGYPLTEANYELLLDKFKTDNYICYYQWADEVGKVHLGIMLTLAVDAENLISQEKDIIDRGRWLHIEEIKELLLINEIELEKWSHFVLSVIDHVYCDTNLDIAA